MSTHPLAQLEFTRRTAKRAQYEAFEFSLTPEGLLVRNASHANPETHEYLVTIDGGIPVRCACPADDHYEGACKHRVAAAIRRPIVEAVTRQELVADGGIPADASEQSGQCDPRATENGDSIDDEGCACADLDDFPCWECVKTGKRSLSR